MHSEPLLLAEALFDPWARHGPVGFALGIVLGGGAAIWLGLRADRKRGYDPDDKNRPIFTEDEGRDGRHSGPAS